MKRIAYSSPFVPAEWIAAHNLSPMRVLPPPPSQGVTQGICPFSQAVMEELARGKYDAAILTTTCDQMRRAPEAHAQPPCPIFLLNVPATWQSATARQMYLDELTRLSEFLAQLGGEPPTDERLATTMHQFQSVRRALRKSERELTARQFVEALFGIPSSQSEIRIPNSEIPLALLGGPLTTADLELLDLIENSGGRIVLNASECGTRPLPGEFDEGRLRDQPLRELARAYFETIPDAFRRPDDLLQAYIKRELASAGVRGVILVRQVWCDLWHAQVQRLRAELGIPLLDLDVSCSPSARAGLATRVGAFLEAMR